mmetsp:Transcript_16187/g.34286  ORF Transcript_16187/g.34286 Transcript_16187/m.34286 type:complete len:139 (-) Transcript_16187:47-463(-)
MGLGQSRPTADGAAALTFDARASQRLLQAARRCDAGEVQKALQAAANPDTRSQHSGRPALSFAAQCGEADAVRHLLLGRADVNAAGQDGRTALHVAVAWERGPATGLLCDHGASRDVRDSHGLSPRTLASRRNAVGPL